MHVFAEIIIGGLEAHILRFNQQNFFADEILGRALGEKWQQRAGLRAAARKLLVQHLLGLALHVVGGNILSGNRRDHTGSGANLVRN